MWPNIFGTFVIQVNRLLALSCRRFESHSKGTFKKVSVKEMKGLLQRSLSRKPFKQPTKGNEVSLADP